MYALRLEPDRDVSGDAVMLELVLSEAGNSDDANLLNPTGRARGYQSYMFAAGDFAKGIDTSEFGRVRKIVPPNIGILVEIQVIEADIVPTAKGSSYPYEFERLRLRVSVSPN